MSFNMRYLLFSVLYSLACINFCSGQYIQEGEHSWHETSVIFKQTEDYDYPFNTTFNCSYVAKDTKFANLTISKDNIVFYSYDNNTMGNPKFTKTKGIERITPSAPGVFKVEDPTYDITGKYICNVNFVATPDGDILTLSARIDVLFYNETNNNAVFVLDQVKRTVQDTLKVSDQFHQLAKAHNETLKQELLKELDTLSTNPQIPEGKEAAEEFLKPYTLSRQYMFELSWANTKLVKKYADLLKIEVNKL